MRARADWWILLLFLLPALARAEAAAGERPDEAMEVRIDLGQPDYPTLFLRMELPRNWWLASPHEIGGRRTISADPHTLLLLRRSQARQAGSHDDTAVMLHEVAGEEAAAETVRRLAQDWVDARKQAGWTVQVPLADVKPTSSLKAGRKRVRLYRGEFAANDNYMISSATGHPDPDVYNVHGFVVGKRAVLLVTREGSRISQLLDGLSLTIRDKPSAATRRVKLASSVNGPDAKDKDCNARLTFELPKGATASYRPTLRAATAEKASSPRTDDGLAGSWTVTGRRPEDGYEIQLHADTRAKFDVRRQLQFWLAQRKSLALLGEPRERKKAGRTTLRCELRDTAAEERRLLVMHVFVVNGVHWRLSVGRALLPGEEDGAAIRKALGRSLDRLVADLHAWETRPFLKPSTAR